MGASWRQSKITGGVWQGKAGKRAGKISREPQQGKEITWNKQLAFKPQPLPRGT